MTRCPPTTRPLWKRGARARPIRSCWTEQRVLMEAMSDEFDVSTLLDTDDQLSSAAPALAPM
jgi:hypothetical protein